MKCKRPRILRLKVYSPKERSKVARIAVQDASPRPIEVRVIYVKRREKRAG